MGGENISEGCGADHWKNDAAPAGAAETRSLSAMDAGATGQILMIGDYRIIRKLGAGGMGVVYEAEQQHPKRLVALKVIRGGKMVDDQQVMLFEREAQALARLKHPGIAAIYEQGRTAEGQHFFAMELVRGETLKEYLDRTSGTPLTPSRLSERLAIYRRIVDAVTYAHQRGVIHRDLKPANIIVQRELAMPGVEDDRQTPAVKILDFGLARITEADLAVATVGTEMGMIRGTLPYMSPEQVRGNPDEIDVRTDVYSLGVILYEMIAGRQPYDLRKVMLHEAAAIICMAAPEPLSKSWSGTKRLDQDLETIVSKALEKQASRRYQSVSALGEDILRFLTGQPISARPPSAVYQLRKMVARHKLEFGFAVSVVVLIAVFALVMSVQARRIASERDRANREAAASAQVAEFLVGLFKASSPAEARGREVTAREILDKGAERIGTDLTRDRKLQARLLLTIGVVYRDLGVLDRAEQLVEQSVNIGRRSLGADAPDSLRAASALGEIYEREGKVELAEKLLTSTLGVERRVLGENHPNTLKTLVNLASLYDTQGRYDKSFPMMQDVFERRKKTLGRDNLDTLGAQYNVAVALYRRQRFDEAERLLNEVTASFTRAVGSDHPHTLITKDLLASVYLKLKRPDDARRILTDVYNTRQRVLGPEHMETLGAKLGLANVEQIEGRLPAAESLYRDTLAVQQRVVGADHPDTLATQVSLATLLSAAGRFDEAEPLYRDTLARMRRVLGPDHPDTSNCLVGLADIELHRGRREEALRLAREAVRVNPVWGPKLAADPDYAALKDSPAPDKPSSTAQTK